jgi:hypothetical protein
MPLKLLLAEVGRVNEDAPIMVAEVVAVVKDIR